MMQDDLAKFDMRAAAIKQINYYWQTPEGKEAIKKIDQAFVDAYLTGTGAYKLGAPA